MKQSNQQSNRDKKLMIECIGAELVERIGRVDEPIVKIPFAEFAATYATYNQETRAWRILQSYLHHHNVLMEDFDEGKLEDFIVLVKLGDPPLLSDLEK